MISSFKLINFKNFANEQLRVGPFTVIVGANASGKSNIRDAFRILHGIGRGYTLSEIIGGKYGTSAASRNGHRCAVVPTKSSASGRTSFTLLVGHECGESAPPAREGKRRTPAREERSAICSKVRQDEMRPGIFRVTREKLESRLG